MARPPVPRACLGDCHSTTCCGFFSLLYSISLDNLEQHVLWY